MKRKRKHREIIALNCFSASGQKDTRVSGKIEYPFVIKEVIFFSGAVFSALNISRIGLSKKATGSVADDATFRSLFSAKSNQEAETWTPTTVILRPDLEIWDTGNYFKIESDNLGTTTSSAICYITIERLDPEDYENEGV